MIILLAVALLFCIIMLFFTARAAILRKKEHKALQKELAWYREERTKPNSDEEKIKDAIWQIDIDIQQCRHEQVRALESSIILLGMILLLVSVF